MKTDNNNNNGHGENLIATLNFDASKVIVEKRQSALQKTYLLIINTTMGKRVFKRVHTVFDLSSNAEKIEEIEAIPLDCSHTINEAKEAVEVDGKLCCRTCAPNCHECKGIIPPGEAETVDDKPFHKWCSFRYKEQFDEKRRLERELIHHQVLLIKANLCKAYSDQHLNELSSLGSRRQNAQHGKSNRLPTKLP